MQSAEIPIYALITYFSNLKYGLANGPSVYLIIVSLL